MLLNKKIPWSYILGKIKYEIIAITCYASAFIILDKELNLRHITVPLTIPSIIGTILSLLLAFRSNQAYDRWWEARIIWGSIVNESRSLIRQLKSFMNDPEYTVAAARFIEQFSKRQIFWCHSLSRMLRKQDSHVHAAHYLSKEDVKAIHSKKHVPNIVLLLHGRDLKFALEEGWLNAFQQVELNKTLSNLCDAMGKCERIKNTVFPTTYGLYINIALYLFILLLPFALTEYLGIVQMIVVVLIAATFLFIEKMAINLQDPFENKPTDTPMSTISKNIEHDLLEMLEDPSPHHAHAVEKNIKAEYYVL